MSVSRRGFFGMAAGAAAMAAGVKPEPSKGIPFGDVEEDCGRIYTRDISGETHLIFVDANCNEIQIAYDGNLLP